MPGWMVASCKQALVQGKQKTARMHRWAHLREKVDCLVVGAGVVGLAIAKQLALDGRNVVVVEAQSTIGTGTSSRNSEVIHAGIYYPRGSLKAALCIQGNQALYSYCQERGIPHNKLGKLIVATAPQQVDMLKRLEQTGRENGADNLQMLSGDQAMQLEPQLQCVKALWSPSTGILDSHSFMLSLQADAEQQGVTFAFNTTVIGGAASNGGIDVFVHDTAGSRGRPVCDLLETMEMVLAANVVVNCAGLHAQAIARSIHGVREEAIPRSYFAKGSYFSVPGSGKPPFSRLIYPVPEEGGLGVHLTLDLGGQMRFGPDVEWLKECDTKTGVTTDFDYGVDPARAESFYSEIRKYYPALGEACLKPDYAGIRAKLSGPGQRGADFVIQDKEAHGVQGLVNLFGIESPGLTASLAIAKLVSLIISSSASSVVSL